MEACRVPAVTARSHQGVPCSSALQEEKAERARQEREKRQKMKQKAKDKVRTEKERMLAERDAKLEAERAVLEETRRALLEKEEEVKCAFPIVDAAYPADVAPSRFIHSSIMYNYCNQANVVSCA